MSTQYDKAKYWRGRNQQWSARCSNGHHDRCTTLRRPTPGPMFLCECDCHVHDDRTKYRQLEDAYQSLARINFRPAPKAVTRQARCKNGDGYNKLFFREDKQSIQEAKQICGLCPVLSACREWAIRQRDLDGVIGGLTPSERKHRRSGE